LIKLTNQAWHKVTELVIISSSSSLGFRAFYLLLVLFKLVLEVFFEGLGEAQKKKGLLIVTYASLLLVATVDLCLDPVVWGWLHMFCV